MRTVSASLVAAFALVTVVGAQAPSPASVASTRDLAREARIILTRYSMYGLSGCTVLAVKDRIVTEHCSSNRDRKTGARNTRTTLFDIGSITKSFTAAAVLDLVDSGRLSLDASLESLLSGVPADKRSITLHQLLTHSAGFPLDSADAGIVPADTREEFVGKALGVRLLHAPGTRYEYSNLGYGLLAVIVERRSNEPFRDYVNRLIQRAGLAHTVWWTEAAGADTAGSARGYLMSDREDVLELEPPMRKPSPSAHSWGKYFLGPAGLMSTAADVQRWVRLLVTGRILSKPMTTAMFTPTVGDEGYGWHIGDRPRVGKRIYRGGLRGGFTSLAAYYPDREVTLTFVLNQSQSGWESLVWRAMEGAMTSQPLALPPATTTLTAGRLRALSGEYPVADGHVRVWTEGDVVMAGAEGQPAADLLMGPDAVPGERSAEQNRLASDIIRAVIDGNSAHVVLLNVNRLAEFQPWLASRLPSTTPTALRILGTVRHPSGSGRTQTFVRLGTAFGDPVIRLLWEQDRMIAWGDGIRLPAIATYRPVARTSLVSFRPRDAGWRTLHLEQDSTGRKIRVEFSPR